MSGVEPNQAIQHEGAARAVSLAIEISPFLKGIVQSVVIIRVGVAGPA